MRGFEDEREVESSTKVRSRRHLLAEGFISALYRGYEPDIRWRKPPSPERTTYISGRHTSVAIYLSAVGLVQERMRGFEDGRMGGWEDEYPRECSKKCFT
jgi:hypothetical protein